MDIRLNTKLISSISNVLYIPAAEMIKDTGINRATWYNIMARPEAVTIQYLLAIANGLHIPVRRFFSKGKADIIGRRDDYIVDPYLPCRYDDAALQRIVDKRPDATWQKAATATGMTPSRLRDSLLAVTRTPAARFLIVCDVFDIDPFTVLVDPNPLPRRRRSPSPTPAAAPGSAPSPSSVPSVPSAHSVEELREEIRRLSATVADLTGKYEALLQAHEKLARRVNVSIDSINNSYLSIAADGGPDR